MDKPNARIAEIAARQQHLFGRIVVLREATAYWQRSSVVKIEPAPQDWEEAARKLAADHLAIGDWLTEALKESLTESRLVLAELQAIAKDMTS